MGAYISSSTTDQLYDSEQTNRKLPVWLTEDWLQPRLVVVTLLAIIASVITERSGAPGAVTLGFNLLSYAAGGYFGAKTALESIFQERKLDVDLLMVLAAIGAAIIGEWREGATLLFLFSLSNVLQDYAIGRSRQAIRGLLKLYPSTAKVRRNGAVETVDIGDIEVGEIILIEPGERIPVDGIIHSGRSSVDQSPITGESIPVEKAVGDQCFAGTLNQQGALDVEATRPATDTVLSRVIKLVEEAQDSKAPTERFLEKFEERYATLILVGVGLFIIVPPALGLVNFTDNFYRAMVLMTVASPCALVISTPASFISAIAAAARGGVLFKGGASLEIMGTVNAVAFDKTGTLTTGRPTVSAIVTHNGLRDDQLLALAASIEDRSEHPLAKAIVNAAKARELDILPLDDFEAMPGTGIVAHLNGDVLRAGRISYLETVAPLPAGLTAPRAELEDGGKTVIGVLQNETWLGLIAVADEVRPESKQIVDALHAQGLKVAMLTGDNQRVAENIAAEVGIDIVHAELMPEQKVDAIKQLQADVGGVAMVGDGVNDAPALAMAEVGLAMGAAGTDVALETADVVLMGDRLELIPYAINLSKKARRVVYQNLTFAIAVIVVLIISVFVVSLPLPLGVLGHEGSTVIVVLNGLISLLLLPELKRRREQARATA